MKMDHHCPWINNCCGHLNHAYFTSFLLLAPLGCSHAAIIFIMTMYTQLYERVSTLLTQRFSFHTDVITNVKLFSLPLAADIIWLEHGEDWHECCASVSAPHALQCSRLCCHTLCLRLGTGHHYCRWHAFHHTGKVFIGVYNLEKLLAMKCDINHDHCGINLAQPETRRAEFSFEKHELLVKQLVAISPNQYIMTGIYMMMWLAVFQNSHTSLTQYYFRYVKMQPGSTNSQLIPII